jgi:hypothetical protein
MRVIATRLKTKGEKHMIRKLALIGATIVATAAGYATPASAQATRTWVSGVGDDANPCSRTAPCKTFAGAISKTAAGGEINCLDPGGFGGVTITKAMSIICQYTEAGVLVQASPGITVNAGVNDVVYLRGLDLHGVGTGTFGVRFIAGAALHIDDSLIRMFGAANANGVSFQPSGASELYITDTVIAENSNAATGNGILIQPTGAGGSAKVVLRGVRVLDNTNTALRVDTTGNTGTGVTVTIEDSQFSGNGGGGIALVVPAGTTTAAIMVVDSTVSNNGGTGLVANGATATMRVGNTTITGNTTGVNAAGGSTINTYGDNRLDGNPTVGAANNGTFTGVAIPKK